MNQFLDCAAIHPDAKVRFRKSDMTLAISSDASYPSASKARSRFGSFFCLSEEGSDDPCEDPPAINGPVLVLASLTAPVMGSAMEAEVAGCYKNALQGCALRIALEEMG